MATRLYTTNFAVPAGTPIAAPLVQPVTLEDNILTRVAIIIPDGHAFLTGVAITWSGAPLVPFGLGTWITANGEDVDFLISEEITANGLSLAGYNTDIFQHTFLLRWYVTDKAEQSSVVISSPQLPGAQPATTAGVQSLSGTALVAVASA